MSQAMPTGLYTRWELDSKSCKFKPPQNRTMNFENMVVSYFQRVRPECKVDSFHTTGTQKKTDSYSVDGFCRYWNTIFEAMGCFYKYSLSLEARCSINEETFGEVIKRER